MTGGGESGSGIGGHDGGKKAARAGAVGEGGYSERIDASLVQGGSGVDAFFGDELMEAPLVQVASGVDGGVAVVAEAGEPSSRSVKV